jgi:hypothetical protein
MKIEKSNNPVHDFPGWLVFSAREEAEKYFDKETLICLIPRETIWYSICLFESNKEEDILLANKILENITATDGTHSQSSLIVIWHKYKDLLSEKSRVNILKNISDAFPLSAFTKFCDGNVNHPLAAYCNLICGGEILKLKEISGIGKFYLYEFQKSIRKESFSFRQTQISEYNSPTYTALNLWFLAIIAEYSDDLETRNLAKSIEQDIWIDTALHFHAPTLQFAGPFSRAYQDDSIGGYSALHCTMMKAMNEYFYIYPGISLKYNHPSNFIQNALIAILNFHLPEHFKETAFNKIFPIYFKQKTFCEQYFENRTGQKDNKQIHCFDDECYPGGWSDLTTYMTGNFTLGTAERQYVNGGHTDSFVFRYKKSEKIESMKDFRCIHLRGVYNDSAAGQDNYCHITNSKITKDYLYEEGRSGIFQHKNKAMVCYFPKRSGNEKVEKFRIDIIWSYFAGFDNIYINEQKAQLPCSFSYKDKVFINDSGISISIIPFKNPSIPDYQNSIQIKNDLLIISLYSYHGDEKNFTREEINQLINGFYFEVSEEQDFEKFMKEINSYKLNMKINGNKISADLKGYGFGMSMVYDFLREKMIERKYDGKEETLNSFYIETNDNYLKNYFEKGLK